MGSNDKLAQFEPQNIPEAMELAKMLAGSALIPGVLRGKPADVMIILMKGRELGLSPLQAMAEVYVVEGRPSASAKLKVGLCLQRRDVCEYFRLVESSPKHARYETKRAGSDPVTLTWTLEQANRAGLLGRATWKAYGETMLRHRCASALADAVYPDLVQGLVTDDEAADIREHAGERAVNTPPGNGAKTDSLKERLRERLAKPPPEDAQMAENTPPPSTSSIALPAETGLSDPPRLTGEPALAWDRIRAAGEAAGMNAAAIGAELKRLTGKVKRSELGEADVAAFLGWVEDAVDPSNAPSPAPEPQPAQP